MILLLLSAFLISFFCFFLHPLFFFFFFSSIVFLRPSATTAGMRLNVRGGVNTGKLVAGVIGKNKFAFDVWGDAVNVASR